MKNPQDKSASNTQEYNDSVAQTQLAAFSAVGVHHTQGGWPKEINLNELSQVNRFLTKIEKEELFTDRVYELATAAESQVMQNIAVNIYSQYFDYEDEIMQFVPTLAGIYLGNETIRANDQIKEDIKRKMIEVFFKNTFDDLRDFYNYEVKKIVENYRYIKIVDDSNTNKQNCDEEFEDCENMNTNQDCDEEFEDCDNINTNNQDCDEELRIVGT